MGKCCVGLSPIAASVCVGDARKRLWRYTSLHQYKLSTGLYFCAASRKQSSVDLMNGEDRMPTDTALARVSLWGMHSDYQPGVWELS